jgi:hypothetical protein
MVGLALAALLVVAARDVGRPGNASGSGLLCLRAVGGLGLGAMALLALVSGQPQAALVAGAGAAPLLAALIASGRGRRLTRPAALMRDAPAIADSGYEERRAA